MKPKSKIATAGIAVTLAVLLVGGAGSLAYFKDSAPGPEAKISAGSLDMTVSGPVVADVPFVTVPPGTNPAGVVKQPGSEGTIPGIQNQTLTYTVTNTGSERAVAKLSGALSGSSTPGAYASVHQHVKIVASVDNPFEEVVVVEPGDLTSDTSFADVPIPAFEREFEPGVAHTVTVTVSIPDSNGVLARLLVSARNKTMVSVQPTFTLTQTPIG